MRMARATSLATLLLGTAPFSCAGGGDPAADAGAGGDAATGGEAGGGSGREGKSGGGGGGASPGEHAGAGGEVVAEAGAGGAGGSDGETSFLPLYEGGTRLSAISIGEAGSETRRLVAFFDEELEAECRFRPAEDGEYRCLPLAKELAPGFADEECSEPVLYDSLATPCAAHPPFVVRRVDDSTCAGARVARLEPRALDAVFDASCTNRLELEDGARVYTEGEALPPERFVRAERVRKLNARGFGVDELRGDDGSRQVLGIADAEYGACNAREVEGGGLRCVPTRAYLDSDWYFADSACEETQLAYAARADGCPAADPVRIALKIEPGSPALPEVVEVGPAVAGPVYELAANVCTERDAAEVAWTLHPLAGAFDVERLLALVPTPAGSGRARLPHHAHEGSLLTLEAGTLGTALFYDSELEARCSTLRTPDGEIVCVPEGAVNTTGAELSYADADCSEPVLAVPAWTGDYFAPSTLGYCGREETEPRLTGDFYAVGGEASGDTYVLDAEGNCQASGSGPYFTLEPAEPDFMPMVERVE